MNKQCGLGLIGAIFVIVVVAILSTAMSQMLVTDSEIQSYEILSLKAFLAAESGAQLGVNRVLPPIGGGSCAARTFTFTDSPLRFCQAVVSCTTLTVSGDNYYTLTSNAQCQAGSYLAQRTVQVRIRQ
ncbi:MAG: hypothetical protein JKY88_09340 [Pseudomonadales bacterium]|nr:hypothetical protein [Pseudomonadales bacterium]